MSAKATELELDVLRGMAVGFMLVNHAGVRWLDSEHATDSVALWLVNLGSHAPVLFFSITGVGYGLSAAHAGPRKPTADVLYKAGLLVIADGFMRGGDFSRVGWDFLAFIGFASVALHLISRTSRPTLWASIVASAILLLRFGIGARSAHDSGAPLWLLEGLGLRNIAGISYWFIPWLSYPLLGFLAAHLCYREHRTHRFSRLGGLGLGAAGLLCWFGSSALVAHGWPLHRWGTISAAYYLESLGVLGVTSACVTGLVRSQAVARVLQSLRMRGVSSFAIVPIHYGLLEVANALVEPGSTTLLTRSSFLLSFAPFLVLCFLLARSFARTAAKLALGTALSERARASSIACLLAIGFATTAWGPSALATAGCFVAQLVVGWLLVVRAKTDSVGSPA